MNETLWGLVALVATIITCLLSYFDGKADGYKQGQIDALNGTNNYILIEFEDGLRWYVKKEDLKDYKPHKIIKK